MFKQFRDKVALSGITVLIIGVAMLIFTFISAYGFLTQSLSIMASADLVQTFGEAFAPLIAACIHIMYLGIMGWIGSLLTIRGITIIAHLPETSTPATQKLESKQQQPQKTETGKQPIIPTKPELKPSEPQFMVIPPGEASEIISPPNQPEKKESQTTS